MHLTLLVPCISFLTVGKKENCTSLADLRTCGLIKMPSPIDLHSQVTRKAIPIGPRVLRPARNVLPPPLFYLLKNYAWNLVYTSDDPDKHSTTAILARWPMYRLNAWYTVTTKHCTHIENRNLCHWSVLIKHNTRIILRIYPMII